MSLILSFSRVGERLYAAGPDGLFRVEGTSLVAQPQPMESLTCCGAAGDTLLVGGFPHGAALLAPGGEWQAGWMDHTTAPVLAFAAAPDTDQSGLVLAATGGDGLLRSTNHGRTWSLCNFGLHEFTLLALAWAPPPPPGRWPRREIVFAAGDRALYRSPAGGLGWQRLALPVEDAFQALALSPTFHDDGLVLAGSENNGLWRSHDGGRTFARVETGPERVDSLLASAQGWLAASPQGVWFSRDTITWRLLANSPAALALCETASGIVTGGESGVTLLDWPQPPLQAG